MPGTLEGGRKATETLIKKFNGDVEAYKAWRRHIGSLGGKKSKGGGFASPVIGEDGLTNAQRAGIKGGKVSRRGKVNKENTHE